MISWNLPFRIARVFLFTIFFVANAVVSQSQIISTIAGNGTSGSSGDGGLAIFAQLYYPFAISSDNSGNLLIPDTYNFKLRRVTTYGIISTIAGTGTMGYSGDGGAATAAQLSYCSAAIVDAAGNTYIADYYNQRIRKIDGSGIITTYAGTGTAGYNGDGIQATAAKLNYPYALAIDNSGNLLISDYINNRVRKIDASTGLISTIVGIGTPGSTGDGGPATAAQIYYPVGIAVDGSGNLFLSEAYGERVRKVNTSGIITTVAGTGTAGYSGDGGPATAAKLYYPYGVAADRYDNLFIADYVNNRVRKVDTSGIITTIAGTGFGGYCCDGSPATSAYLHYPTGVSVDGSGNVYVADYYNSRIRMVRNGNHPPFFLSGHHVSITVCDDTLGIPINNQLAVMDSDYWQTLEWDTLKNPSHGSLFPIFLGVSYCRTVTPTPIMKYYPAAGFSGKDTFSYTVNDGMAYDTITIYATVNRVPGYITGTTGICVGATTTLSDTSAGVWGSSNTTVATVGPTGVVTSLSPGVDTIYYSLTSTGCQVDAVVTVNPVPVGISSPPTVCTGSMISMSDATYGGSWSSSNVSVASVDPGSGNTTGISSGTATITYSLVTSCNARVTVTVNSTPSAISGPTNLCIGLTATLSDASSGGSWSSSNTAVATINSGTGLAGAVSVGTAVITYAMGTGCRVTTTIAVNPLPSAITGLSAACAGSTATLSDATGGGTWSSHSTSVATVDGSGVVYAATAGTTTITYTLATGCIATGLFTVNPLPAAIAGTGSVCVGLTVTLSDATAGGSWSSSNVSAATISGSGVTGGVAAGTSIISYTLSSTGCVASTMFTVNPLPGAIGGSTTSVCSGNVISLTDAMGGGSWTSGATSVATVGASTGMVTGVTAGTANITYALGTGCRATQAVTVNTSPSPISGTTTICTGTTSSLSDALGGGSWSSSGIFIASVNPSTGAVTGMGIGTATITYKIPTSGCYTTTLVTVNSAPTAISGTNKVCAGQTITLSDATTGGSWSSSAATVATVSSTGTVTGVTGGTTVITYSIGSCTVFKTVSVYPLASISGTTALCMGSPATLSDAVTGGTWSSSTTGVATINSSGLVSPVSAGTTTISYALSSGCTAVAAVTVNSLPAAITGATNICAGSASNLTDAGGGTWSSSNIAVATITAGSGVVTGVAGGTSTITYTLPTGCSTTVRVTAFALPAPITGTTAICPGTTTNLSDISSSGTWSSSNVSVATVTSTGGSVGGVAAGTTVISYTQGSGCSATAVVTVNPLPGAIAGTPNVCTGQTTTLSNPSTGGTWSSSNPAIASVGVTSGVVNGIVAGTSIITYASGIGCQVTQVVTVNLSPSPILGSTSMCVATTSTLSDAAMSGVWTSSDPSVASVGMLTHIVTGVSVGTATITCSSGTGGCYTTTVVTVNSVPVAISGPTSICNGSTVSLTDAGGGIWSSSSPSVASINSASGAVSGMAIGTANITYSLGTGCTASTIVTVQPSPSAISGVTAVCTGATTPLSDGTGGGTWSSVSTSIATINTGGTAGGVSAGTSVISYTLSSGCAATTTLTVNATPGAITGVLRVCAGQTTSLTDGGGGTWSSGTTSVATVTGTGVVSGVAAGTAVITYSLGGSCVAAAIVTVNASPGSINGITAVCTGATTSLSNATGGGTWSSVSTSVATINTGGTAGGVSAGTSVISYALSSGCAAITTLTVNAVPASITGANRVCAGQTTSLTDAGGGTWSSGTASVATVTGTGVVTGVAAGTAVITYSLGGSCVASAVMTVNTSPAAISGVTAVCTGATTSLSNTTGGGAWSSATTSVATVTAGGLVNGVSAGTSVISYALTTGCAATTTITVNSVPGVITGSTQVCIGSTSSLTDAGGGTWTSGSTAVATVAAATGIVSGVTTGTSVITYSLGGSCVATTVVTVNAAPSAISGSSNLCMGSYTTLSDLTSGGIWSSGTAAVATAGSGGIIYGVSAGTAIISYTTGSGCAATKAVTVYPVPGAISGTANICTSATATLSDAAGGGTWSSSNPSVASIDASGGTVTGMSAGTARISYSLGGGCAVSSVITVNSSPSAILGSANICAGLTTILSDVLAGGTWSSSNSSVATAVVGSGLISGVSAGTANITYAMPSGCKAVTAITVNSVPPAITGTNNACIGTTTMLSDIATGGTWSSGRPSVATIDASGTVSALAAGTAIITYSIGTGCGTTTVFTTDPPPPSILGSAHVCFGQTVALSDALGGGTWSSSSTANATIDASTGVVSGVAPGTTVISYTNGCTTATTVTVSPTPPAILGTTVLCNGLSAILSDVVTGGTWSSSSITVATVAPVTGSVTALSVGVVNITYTSPAGCTTWTPVIVNPSPSAIMGTTHLCEGATVSLSDFTAGGTWSSNNASIATIDMYSGAVTGVSGGTVMMSYEVSGCPAITFVTVNNNPAPISGIATVCAGGGTVHVSDADTGGSWTSVYVSISPAGVVSGLAPGTGTIYYTLPTGCGTSATITVNPLPAMISGSTDVCVGGITSLSDPSSSGVWASSPTATATVAPGSGTVYGVASGIAIITYQLTTTGCMRTATVTVFDPPVVAAISGAANVCQGASITLTDATTGGAWARSNASATVSGGVVTGVIPGLDTIMYSIGNVCGTVTAGKAITIIPLPDAGNITGANTVCAGASTTLSDAVAGGVWSAAGSSATVAGGVVTGVSQGLSIITYTYANSCGSAFTTATIAVSPQPDAGAITGNTSICPGETITLTDPVTGGAWGSGNAAIATVNSAGVMTGVGEGTTTVGYSVTNSCGTATAVLTVTVLPRSICDAGVRNVATDESSVRIYPNPNDGTFTIYLQSDMDEQAQITITNVTGQTVKELSIRTNNETRISLAGNELSAGIYLLHAVTGHGAYDTKLVINAR